MINYKKVYNKDYFTGKGSCFYRFGYGRFFHNFGFNQQFQPLKKYLTKGKARVLDIGCAYGLMLKRFPKNYEKYGIDVSEYAISQAKIRVPEGKFQAVGAEESIFEDNFFDIVISNDVLEHLNKPVEALKNINRILKKGGILYITAPNLNIFRQIIFKNADLKEHHISLMSHKELIGILEKNGFEITERWTFVSGFPSIRFKSHLGTESMIICKKL